MLTQLTAEFTAAAAKFPKDVTQAAEIWKHSLSEIINLVKEKALELGRELRSDIAQAAKIAVDRVVALDLPYIPAGIEGTIDEATRTLGYDAIESALDFVLGKQS